MTNAVPAAFDNVREQIGFCGIWCGSCIVGNGALPELTRRYLETTEAYGLPEWAPRDFDHDELTKGLSSIGGIPPCVGCRRGGGRDDCEIRACALSKHVESCTECDEFGACEHAAIVERMRAGARAAGLFVREIDDADTEEAIERWSAALRGRWPCCVLFTDDR